MKLKYDYGDVVETTDGPTPTVLTIFGELNNPSEGGIVYVGGNENTFGQPDTGHSFRKIGVDLTAADKYRERYLTKVPAGLKDL